MITSYNTASYQIEKILWDATAATQKFIWKERDISTGQVTKHNITVAEYFERKYV